MDFQGKNTVPPARSMVASQVEGARVRFDYIAENLRARRAEIGSHPLSPDRVLGFTLIRGWVYLMFVGAAASSMTWTGEALPPVFYTVSTASLCAVLLASALAGSRFVQLMLPLPPGSPGPCSPAGAPCFWPPRSARAARTTFEVPLAFFLAAVVFSLVIALPPTAGCVVCSLLPAISGWILVGREHAWSRKHRASVLPIDFDLKSFAWRIGVCACLVGVADGMVRAAFLSSNNLSMHMFLQWPLAGAGLLTMAIVYGAAILSSEQSARTIYKAAIFVMAFFFMLLPVFTGAQDVESVLALAGYGTFNVLIWMLLAEISYTYRLSSTEVFGIGWAMVTLGVLLGSIAGTIVDQFAPFTPQFLSLIALVATMAVLLSFLFVFRESDLIDLTEEPDGDNAGAIEKAAESPSSEGVVAVAGESGGDEGRRPRFHDRCLEVAAAFELSPKETEVMTLFAKGRSAARIQEELFISKGTVSTHLRHIYQKMDVHSKQELLDVIEDRDRK